MILKQTCLFLFIAAVAGLFAQEANAQRRRPHYTRNNTISPYIQLFQGNNGGGFNNYFTEVRPRLQMQRNLNEVRAQDYRNAAFQAELISRQSQVIQQTLERGLIQTTQMGVGARPATAARFQSTGNFFPQPPLIQQRSRYAR